MIVNLQESGTCDITFIETDLFMKLYSTFKVYMYIGRTFIINYYDSDIHALHVHVYLYISHFFVIYRPSLFVGVQTDQPYAMRALTEESMLQGEVRERNKHT